MTTKQAFTWEDVRWGFKNKAPELSKWFESLPPGATSALLGAGLGGGAMTLASLGGPESESPARRRRRLLTNFVTGAGLGGLAGYALPKAGDLLSTAAPEKAERDKDIAAAAQVYARSNPANSFLARLGYAGSAYSMPKLFTAARGHTAGTVGAANSVMQNLLNEIAQAHNDLRTPIQEAIDKVVNPGSGKNKNKNAPSGSPQEVSVLKQLVADYAANPSDTAVRTSKFNEAFDKLLEMRAQADPKLRTLAGKFRQVLPNAKFEEPLIMKPGLQVRNVKAREITDDSALLQKILKVMTQDRAGFEKGLQLTKRFGFGSYGSGPHGAHNLRNMPGYQSRLRGMGPAGNAAAAVAGFALPEITKLLIPGVYKVDDTMQGTFN